MTTTKSREYKVIGTRPIRPDGTDKVTGRAQYGADVRMTGMLFGRVKRSPHAHAVIKRIDASKALALPGVSEHPHFDRRAFKAVRSFVTLAADERTANFKFTPDEQALKCAVAPEAFAPVPGGWGRQGWTMATLAALSEAELAAALDMAWRHGAEKRAKVRTR